MFFFFIIADVIPFCITDASGGIISSHRSGCQNCDKEEFQPVKPEIKSAVIEKNRLKQLQENSGLTKKVARLNFAIRFVRISLQKIRS